jgi:hypothetical protein
MTIKQKSWHREAIKLREQGHKSRLIGEILGVGKSTVNDFFKKMDEQDTTEYLLSGVNGEHLLESIAKFEKAGPRILVYDIETAPLLAHVWKLWDNNVGLNQIDSDWYIMSVAAKWLDEDEVFYWDQQDVYPMEDDTYLLSKLWSLLNEADIVIGQNVRRFDTKKVNARFVLNGFPKPSTYRQIDTMVIAKDQFGFTSNKLEYMTEKLCPEHKKSKHANFPGHTLWAECLRGNPEAWAEMREYNIDDIYGTEALYNVLSSWDSKLPNFDIYVDDLLDMSDWVDDGFVYTQFAKYKRYRNINTGVQRRSRVNELSKEKRQQLLANIV